MHTAGRQEQLLPEEDFRRFLRDFKVVPKLLNDTDITVMLRMTLRGFPSVLIRKRKRRGFVARRRSSVFAASGNFDSASLIEDDAGSLQQALQSSRKRQMELEQRSALATHAEQRAQSGRRDAEAERDELQEKLSYAMMEVNARADPPVCRLMRYDSFRYARKQKEREGRRAAVERRRADTVKELKLTARISPNDMRVKAAKAQKFLANGHKVTLRVEFKTNDGVKPSLRKKAGDVLFDEFRRTLTDSFQKPHVVVQEGKMVGPNHMTITLAPEREARKGKTKKGKLASDAEARAEARPSGDEDKDEANAPIPEGADPATFLAEATAQGDVVRALKARRSSGDDAVQQKDVDDAVARLLRLKARAESLRGDSSSRAPKTSVAPSGAASGRAWQHLGDAEAGSLAAQPPPQLLEPASPKIADLTAFGPLGPVPPPVVFDALHAVLSAPSMARALLRLCWLLVGRAAQSLSVAVGVLAAPRVAFGAAA